MKNLKQLLTQPLPVVPTSIIFIILGLALIGFVDATYLTIEHYQGSVPPCSVGGGIFGCDTVLTSSYSEIFGIPMALFGSIYYLLVMVGAFAYLEGRHERLLKMALILICGGFLFTLSLIFIMAFILKAWCLYCLISALTTTILFGLTVYIFKRSNV